MADEEGQDEKKDKPKEDKPKEEKPKEEKQEGESKALTEIKRTQSKFKKPSRMIVASRSSLKKLTESAMSNLSQTSSGSTVMKRPSSFEKLARVPKYQNTYRLDSKKPFKPHEVYKILESVVLREVEDYHNYDPVMASKLVQSIAADVRSSVRLLSYDRYKICVLVYLGEKKLQGFQAAFRALWDHERDAWTTYFYQSRTYFISCTCYGLYHD